MSYAPKVGTEFEILTARTRHVAEVTRSTIAIAIIVASIVALAVTASVCAFVGEFGPLVALWATIAAPLGWIVCHYFRGSTGDAKDDDTSAA